MSTPTERRQAELVAKLGLLRDELAYWQGLAAAGGVLEKHHSQLLRLGQVLGSALTQLDGQRDAVESWAATTEQLLGVHHVWDFFRSKFALRLVKRFRPALIAADELAWACVRPLHDAALAATRLTADDVREPPLVYFDASGSPFALGRRHAYRNLLPAKRLSDVPGELVKQLPVPVIGIPWHQQAHLPETAVIAHEAAHVVDDDLSLTDELLPLLEQRLEADARLPDWSQWLPEVLADVLAAVRLGPAYGLALADLIAVPPLEYDASYPPPGIRLRLVVETLNRLKHPSAGPDEPLTEAAAAYEPDVEPVVDVLIESKLEVLGGRPLRGVEPFTVAQQEQAVEDAGRLGLVPPKSQDPRVLIAAGVRAFADNPASFVKQGKAALVFDLIESIRAAGTRADEDSSTSEEVQARDRRLGDELLGLLAQ
ncbi:MAG TPA: hypothetical protein VFT31_08435 [Kribbella sp.]|nr:hypothetical protein [Kribbella sp.]